MILASLVSTTPGIMHDIWRSNTLTDRAQSDLHLLGRFALWTTHPTVVYGSRHCTRCSGKQPLGL